MEYQELKYLRDELNALNSLHSEYINKTINMVLLILGGALVFLGNSGIRLSIICTENIFPYFIMVVVLFVSNMILFYTARKYYDDTDSIARLAAYLAIFYETRPNETVKVDKNFGWELAIFEIDAMKKGPEKDHYKRNGEYVVLTSVSIVLMFIFLTPLVLNIFSKCVCGIGRTVCIIVSLIYVVCLVFSIIWLCKIPRYTFLKDDCAMKAKHMDNFIKYAIDTGHDTEESIKSRLGDVWDLVKDQNCGNRKNRKNNCWRCFLREIKRL